MHYLLHHVNAAVDFVVKITDQVGVWFHLAVSIMHLYVGKIWIKVMYIPFKYCNAIHATV